MAIDAKFIQWPPQKLSDSDKTETWYKKNVDAAVMSLAYEAIVGTRETRRNKIINYNLANNILDRNEVERVVNPMKIKNFDFPTEMHNYPIVMPKIDTLVGEELKMTYFPVAKVINESAISDKERELKSAYLSFIANQVAAEDYDEAKAKEEKERLDIWAKYEYQEVREKMANDLLTYFFHYLDLPTLFNKGYMDFNISGEECYLVDINAGEPYVEKLNPIAVSIVRMGSSWKHEDADAIVIDGYYPIGWVRDHYYDVLKEADMKKLDNAVTGGGGNVSNNMLFEATPERTLSASTFLDSSVFGQMSTAAMVGSYFGGAYDAQGNVRVIRVFWKSVRKVGIMTFWDENGLLQKVPVPDGFKPDAALGQKVKWYWVNEWLKAARIAEDIYTDMGPWAGNKYGMDNFQLQTSPVIGSVLNINTSRSMSIMDRAKPFQYLYNSVMYRTWKNIIKSRKVASINAAMLPEGMNMDKLMYYADELGYIIYNPFEEGKKGQATGKLAGHLNQPPNFVDSDQSSLIQQGLNICAFLEQKISEITGVTPQRQGAIEQRELVGNVQRSVVQSSLNTSYQLNLHVNTKDRVCTALLEIAKVAYKGKKFKKSFVLSDMSERVLDFDAEKYCEADYGIFTVNAEAEDRVGNLLRDIAAGVAKQDMNSVAAMVDIMETKSPADRKRKFELVSLKAREATQQQAQMQQQMEQARMQQDLELAKEKLRIEEEDNIRKADTALEVAAMQLQGKQMDIDANNNGIPDNIDIQKVELEREKMNQSREEAIRKATLEREKLSIQREKIQADERAKKYAADRKPKSTR